MWSMSFGFAFMDKYDFPKEVILMKILVLFTIFLHLKGTYSCAINCNLIYSEKYTSSKSSLGIEVEFPHLLMACKEHSIGKKQTNTYIHTFKHFTMGTRQ